MKKQKPTPLDDVEARPKPEPIDDEVTLEKLDKLPDAGLDEAPPAQALDRMPEAKRAEASAALKVRWKRMRAFVTGAEDEIDW